MSRRTQARAGSAALERSDAGAETHAVATRRSAWLLGLLAVGVYLGFIAWNLLRAAG
jgi:hypothetical protein